MEDDISTPPDRTEGRSDAFAAHGLALVWSGWWLVATTLAALVLATRYTDAMDVATAGPTLLFGAAMLVAHFGFLTCVALLPVVLLAALRAPPRLVVATGVVLSSTYLLLLLLDTEVYRLFRFHIDAGVLNLLFGGAALETFIFPSSMYRSAAVVVAGIGTGVVAVAMTLWWTLRRYRPWRGLRWLAIGGFAVSVFVFHGVHIWADATIRPAFTMQTDLLPLRYAATAKRMLRSLGFELAARDARQLPSTRSGAGLDYPVRDFACQPTRAPRNVVLIAIDSWRYDALTPQVTPRIARFAEQASVFTDHWSGGNATRIGIFSLFYSIPGTYWHRVLDEGEGPVAIREFLRHGYDVRPFRSTPLFSPEFDRTVFVDLLDPRMRSDGADPAEWDRDLTSDFVDYLGSAAQSSSPYFAFLFYDAPHSFIYPDEHPEPFKPTASAVNYLELDEHTDPAPLRNRYLNSVNFVDGLVGNVLDALATHGSLSQTIVLITGDHGTEFNDTGQNFWRHNGNFSRYQAGVPLVWYEPDRPPAKYTHRTSHFDVMPTLLGAALGCDVPFEAVSVGHPLFADTPREAMVLSDYNTFAIVGQDVIAEVKPYGMSLFRPPYERLAERDLAPELVSLAIEQKSRFYETALSTSK